MAGILGGLAAGGTGLFAGCNTGGLSYRLNSWLCESVKPKRCRPANVQNE